jgi:hypothetical protein
MIKKIPYILIALFVLAIILSPLFIKVKIECKSQLGDCAPELASGLQNINSESLFSARNTASKLLKKDYLVSDFSTQFKLPDILLVNIIAKKPVFAIKDPNSGNYLLVDQKGMAIEISDITDLPTVSTSGQLNGIGKEVGSEDLFALNLISGISEMYQVGYGTITNDALVVDMPVGVRVIFPLEGDSEVLLGAFRLIYTKVTSSYLGTYSEIDMRYKNPVLR